MPLDKAILHKKEKRTPYRRSKVFDYSCRHQGNCSRCEADRLYQENKLQAKAKDELKND